MKIFVTGATGYIGGSVAVRFVQAGHRVSGLTRSEEKAVQLKRLGIEPVLGDLNDAGLLTAQAREADAVVNAADSDHAFSIETLIAALAGSGKALLHSSGSSIVGDDARGEPSAVIFDDDSPIEPTKDKAARVAIDRAVLAAGSVGVRSIILCNSLIYGNGLGLHKDSIQIPDLVRQARKSGIARHVGRGLNIWSTVHIADVADLYILALEKADPGSFMFVENGEASFADMAGAIGRALRLGAAQSWAIDDAIAEWGYERAVYALGSNSRVRGPNARKLGWTPHRPAVIDWIDAELSTARPA